MSNREYKSDIFSMLMEDPKNALSLYNAVNGSDYTDPDEVEMCIMDRSILLRAENDSSYILDMHLNVYKHQFTMCTNIPIRSFVYITVLLGDILKNIDISSNSFDKTLIPKLVVFYNGEENQPETYDMKLSEKNLIPVIDPNIEQLGLICRVYNLSKGRNKELLGRCQFIMEYITFVDYVREYQSQFNHRYLRHAIELAMDRCIKEDILRKFLIDHRTEVVEVIISDYEFDRQLTLEREGSRAEGLAEGRADKIYSKLLRK